MTNFFNNRFELLLMIDLYCLRFRCKMIFVIIGPGANFFFFWS
jgi:hypothetical protein